MKFLICLTLVICGACGVLSAPDAIQDALNQLTQTTAASTSTTTSDPIQDALDKLTQLGKDLSQNITDATNGLSGIAVNGTNSLTGTGAGSGLLTPILNLISSTVQNVINGISKPILDAINNVISSVTKNVSDQVTKISNLTSCANVTNSLNIQKPIENLIECAKNSMDQAIQPVNQGVQVINLIGSTISIDIANALKCASTPIFIFPNVLCFANAGLQTVLHGFSAAGNIFSLGATIVNNVLTIIPNNIQCTNTQINNFANSVVNTGAEVGQCLS